MFALLVGMQILHAASLGVIAMTIGLRTSPRAAMAIIVAVFVGTFCISSSCCVFFAPITLCIVATEVIVAAVCYHDLTVNLRHHVIRQ